MLNDIPHGARSASPRRCANSGRRSVLRSLFDVSFDYLATPRLIKLSFVVAHILIVLQCLMLLLFGWSLLSWAWGWGLFFVVGAPVAWLFEIIVVRIFMEAAIIRFRGVEYLRVMKDRGYEDQL
jgi:hypothetical protein